MAKNSEDRKSKKKNGSKAKKELVAENRRLLALKREMNNEQRDLRRVVRELSKRIQEKLNLETIFCNLELKEMKQWPPPLQTRHET